MSLTVTARTGKVASHIRRIPQSIPLPWSEYPASKHLIEQTKWLTGIRGRLPRHYMAFYQQWEKGPEEPIHERPTKARFEKNEFGQVVHVQNPKVPVLYPEEFHTGLWGGEGVVKGGLEPPPTKHQPNYAPAKETYWWPKLHLGVVYSEILDKYMEIIMTNRAQRLIDEAYGLDNYLLETKVNEIYSHLGMKLKRELLLTLANPDQELYPADAAKRSDLLDKYKDYVMPLEEADWHGLPFNQAVQKQFVLDRMEDEENVGPLKLKYRQELVDMLKAGYLDDVDPNILYDDPALQEHGVISTAIRSLKKTFK